MNKKDKNKEIIVCPICLKSTHVIKHGTRKGMQRYLCKNCNKTFNDPQMQKTKYERNTKRVLSLLLNLLENNFFGEEYLEKALQMTDKTQELSVKVQFNSHFAKEYKNCLTSIIGCQNPKLLICQDEKAITFIQLPFFEKNSCILSPKDRIEGTSSRTIKIIDDQFLGEANWRYNKPYIK